MTAGIENAYSHAYMKIFKTFDKNVVSQCQFYMNKLPMELEIALRRLKFLKKVLMFKTNVINHIIGTSQELQIVANKYNCDATDSFEQCKNKMWLNFESRLNNLCKDV